MESDDVYRLQYEWRIRGPIASVFYYLSHVTTFTQWWSAVFLDARSDAKDPCVGATATVRAKSVLPYHLDWQLRMTEYEPTSFIGLEAEVMLGRRVGMRGTIVYRLTEDAGIVRVVTDQHMYPLRPIPWGLRSLAAMIFRFNHRWAMARGEVGLQRIVTERPVAS